MGRRPPKWLPGERVHETILMQRKSVERLRAEQVLRRDKLKERRDRHKNKIDAKRKRKLQTKRFRSPDAIIRQAERAFAQRRKFAKIGERVICRRRLVDERRLHRDIARRGVVLVVRAKGNLIPIDVCHAFEKLGLNKIYKARLIHLSLRTERLIAQLKPFSIIGTPSPQVLEQLLRTRAYLWIRETQTRRLIGGNRILEDVLGRYDIFCIEDLTAAIAGSEKDEDGGPVLSPHLDAILATIAPFDFHPPHMLYLERHRGVHQKLEVMNPAAFTQYLKQQLEPQATPKRAPPKKAPQRRPREAEKSIAKKYTGNSD